MYLNLRPLLSNNFRINLLSPYNLKNFKPFICIREEDFENKIREYLNVFIEHLFKVIELSVFSHTI